MKYTYTTYREDGIATEVVESEKQLSFKGTANKPGLYDMIGCRTIEIIPRDYYPGSDAENENVTYYGDEEARFVDDFKTNNHMKVLIDSRGGKWDVVGTLVREEKISE